MRTPSLLLALLVAGCAQDAVLELTVEIPEAAEPGPRYAVVDARAGEPVGAPPGDVVGLDRTAAGDGRVSIVAEPGDAEQPLHLRVRFCDDPSCTGAPADVPQVRLRIERAFYPGEHTFLTVRIEAVPTGTEELPDVGKCEVRGCVSGESATYCLEDGAHLCEC